MLEEIGDRRLCLECRLEIVDCAWSVDWRGLSHEFWVVWYPPRASMCLNHPELLHKPPIL